MHTSDISINCSRVLVYTVVNTDDSELEVILELKLKWKLEIILIIKLEIEIKLSLLNWDNN